MSTALHVAQRRAQHLLELLSPLCERAEVAGSIRREVPRVKDIEIVVQPEWSDLDLFGEHREPRIWEAIRQHHDSIVPVHPASTGQTDERVALRPDAKYQKFWLPRAKMHLDLFIADPETWGMTLWIRTGSAVAPAGVRRSRAIGFTPACLARWKRMTNGGCLSGNVLRNPFAAPSDREIRCAEEAEVFEAMDLPWFEPRSRRCSLDLDRVLARTRSTGGDAHEVDRPEEGSRAPLAGRPDRPARDLFRLHEPYPEEEDEERDQQAAAQEHEQLHRSGVR